MVQLSTSTQLKNLAVDIEAKDFENKQLFANVFYEATHATHDAFFLAWRNVEIAKEAIDGLTDGQQREDLKNLADKVSQLVDLEGDLKKLCDEATKLYKSAHGIQ